MGEKRKRSNSSHSEIDHVCPLGDEVKSDVELWQAELVVKGEENASEERQKTESTRYSAPQPLTEENLALLEGDMAGQKRKAIETEDGSEKPKGGASETSIRWAAEVMEKRGILFCDPATADAPLVRKVKAWVIGKRDLVMSTDDTTSFLSARHKFRMRNEATFIERVWSLLLLKTRTVRTSENVEEQDNDVLVRTAWEDDGLDYAISDKFYPDSLPMPDAAGDATLQALFKEMPRISTPMPDRVYGLDEDKFTPDERNISFCYERFTRVARTVYYVFFVVEFKGYLGVMGEAHVQARRSGAALVSSMREFKEKAGLLDEKNNADDGNYVFTLTMTPDMAQMYMHWAALEANKRVIYHMHLLKSYILTDAEHVTNLRRDVDNVMDWGLGIRKDYIKRCLRLIKERDPKFNVTASSFEQGEEDSSRDRCSFRSRQLLD